MVAFLPRIEPSARRLKAAVEQPVFVAQTVAVRAAEGGRPPPAIRIAKEAINKLATRPARADARTRRRSPRSSIPIDDARRLCAEGLVAFAKGDIATRARLPASGPPKAATPGR